MISKELLKEVLMEQQKKVKQAKNEGFVTRERLDEIRKFAEVRHSIVITGVRRCGKSVFLSQIMDAFFENCYYINFEDERLAGFDLNDFNRLYEACIELFGKSRNFFVDEIQNVAGWERWVRRMYEDGFKFFITGSNARLLSKELASSLTGRHLQFSLFPFSFREFLAFNKFEFRKEDVYLTERRAIISKYLSEYLKGGGFPEYLKYKRTEILQEYFNDIIQRDIVERYQVKNIKQLKDVARYLVTNTGNLVSFNQLKNLTEMKSVNSAIKYFAYLENAYLLFGVPYFSYSLRKQSANPLKVFAIDTGLRNSISFTFSKDIGRLYETAVAIQLKRKNNDIYYWKSQSGEVDFVVKEGNDKKLIQVCYDINDPDVRKREINSLLKAAKELKTRSLVIITEDKEGEDIVEGKKIIYRPLWKWLLE